MQLFYDLLMIAQGKSTEKVSLDVRNQRLGECRACVIDGEWGMMDNGRCRECGCPLVEKTKYAEAECPIGKWKAEQIKKSLWK